MGYSINTANSIYKYNGHTTSHWPVLTVDSPMSAYIYRIQQSLRHCEISFGNTPRQNKKRTKFNNRFKLGMNYGLVELQRCLLLTSHSY